MEVFNNRFAIVYDRKNVDSQGQIISEDTTEE